MRVLGWVMFAATCVLFALQGLFLAASTFPMTSYEVLVDQVFPLLGIGAMVGAGVGALIVSRYPRNLIGWLFLVGQLGNAIGLAAEAFGVSLVLPFSVFADSQGRIVALKVGELHADQAAAILDRVRDVDANRLTLTDARHQIADKLRDLATEQGQKAAAPDAG